MADFTKASSEAVAAPSRAQQRQQRQEEEEEEGEVGKDAPAVAWWKAGFSHKLTPQLRAWFQQYTGVADSHLEQHLLGIRSKAWDYHQYPCVGSWIFLLPVLAGFPSYRATLGRAVNPAHFSPTNPFQVLDLGCCFGQDLRRLVADGLDPRTNDAVHFVATDLHQELWQLGFDLFRDRDRLPAHFCQMDWLSPDATGLGFIDSHLKGKTDMVLACQFFHLFSWTNQKVAARRVIECSRIGTVVFGFQVGSVDPREVKRPWGDMFFHNAATFNKLWSEIAQETATAWRVDVALVGLESWALDREDFEWMGPDKRAVNFACTRMA